MSVKPPNTRAAAPALIALIAALSAGPARADEGMWTFDAFPARAVERSLGVRLEQPWLDHLRAGSVRLTTGCSAALVSPRGLVATNQHCVLGCVQSLSGPGRDYFNDGFGIAGPIEPKSCPGLQAEILVGIRDVTSPIFDASAGKFGDDFVHARERVLAAVERQACGSDRRYRCQVISFFGGGLFKLYKYRRYADVRLVFTPEFPVAFFGGDPENFTFPRYDLDVAMLRLYERGVPVTAPAWLAWSSRPPAASEAVFVSGSPGSTDRALTVAQLETLRDIVNPELLSESLRSAQRLSAYAARGPDERVRVADRLFEAQNSLKILRGQAATLADASFMSARRDAEIRLRGALAADSALMAQIGDPWTDVAALRKIYAQRFPVWRRLESGAGGGSRLFWYARALVRGAQERARPSSDRLPEYADARLALLQKNLLDPQVVDPGLETILLEAWLADLRATLAPGDPALAGLLGAESPAALASRLIKGSSLADPAVRAALWKGGAAAIEASQDPLIVYVRANDASARLARQAWEDDIIGPTQDAAERIARLRFVVSAAGVYPDATYSPRISFGRVQGWRDATGPVAAFTTVGGLFSHASGAAPLKLPDRWLAARGALDPDMVLNFVTTNDIVGGNSGSPVVDAAGRVLGLAFDGNLPSISGAFAYDGAANRTVAVSSAAVSAALVEVYGRGDLARELNGR